MSSTLSHWLIGRRFVELRWTKSSLSCPWAKPRLGVVCGTAERSMETFLPLSRSAAWGIILGETHTRTQKVKTNAYFFIHIGAFTVYNNILYLHLDLQSQSVEFHRQRPASLVVEIPSLPLQHRTWSL